MCCWGDAELYGLYIEVHENHQIVQENKNMESTIAI
jgi:hypothetical protein